MRRCSPLLTAALLLAPAAARAEALDLEAAVSRALSRHPTVRAAEEAIEGARDRTAQARSAWHPRADARALYRYAGPVPRLEIDTGLTLPGQTEPVSFTRELTSPHFASATLELGWRAWDFGRPALVDAALAGERAAGSGRDRRAVELAHAVRQAYLSTLFFRELEATTARSLDVARSFLDEARAAVAAGLGRDVDVAAADARTAELEARLVDAREGAAQAEGTLRLLLGLAADAPLDLTSRLAALPDAPAAGSAPGRGARDAAETSPPRASPGRDAAVAPAPDAAAPRAPDGAAPRPDLAPPPAAHPRLRELEATAAALDRQRDAIGGGHWPALDVFGTAGVQTPEFFGATDGVGYPYTVGAQLTWSLFDGDLRARRQDELAAKRSEVEHLREAAAEDLTRAALEARARARAAAASIAAAERRAAAADAYLAAARAAAGAGTGTPLDARRAEEALDQARLALLRARLDAGLARAAELQALGIARDDPRSNDR